MKNTKLAVLFSILAFGFTGCTKPTSTTTTSTTTTVVTPTPLSVTVIADGIQIGVSTALTLGLAAIPTSTEAKSAASEAATVINSDVLPILNGSDAGLASSIQQILALNAFNSSTLTKIKAILTQALNLLPVSFVSNVTNQVVDPNAKTYLLAFFNGAASALNNYVGNTTNIDAMRVTLTK